ncbi:hypothetical protein PP7435_CHR4-0313 [Komagataella phaffii CBS 7435]|uniref:Nodulin-like domain-containing protein n=2 Tax=Komagataella phaffii TaxID=460519 RepID=C4R8I9_KOMPG|nr:uncharacterized protein PAS_chr4_0656 [Komagataella phaffii GS115]AOA64762.1 GQ67_05031T0 [Komagataella phaffii]CAH2450684.1 hypothetical protein BQ9382_C4-1640 [Komagataella phaffii CBS 7435]AOA69973.1 GQ68_05012T0 [Komagataella phaffii GS115]CAY71914.1 Putative protein of unknown function [Komagataella phaffii GS115]CCA40484.1 hypothetical protein PP7435_CHR4-0313 [Komagataella phaffii CBS 7435]
MAEKKVVSLIFSALVSLAAGTPYLFGTYAPQLAVQCHLTASGAATLSLASNVGTSIGGLPIGLFIDHNGPSMSIFIGAFLEFIGFGCLYYAYIYRIDSLLALSMAMVCTGMGSVLSFYSCLKSATANFPNHRGSAGSVPVSSYGLSALMYSTVAATFFADNTSGLLKFVSLFCGIVIGISSFFVILVDSGHPITAKTPRRPNNENLLQERARAKPITKADGYGSILMAAHRGSFAQATLMSQSVSSLFSTAGPQSDSSPESSLRSSNSSVLSFHEIPTSNSAAVSRSNSFLVGSAGKYSSPLSSLSSSPVNTKASNIKISMNNRPGVSRSVSNNQSFRSSSNLSKQFAQHAEMQQSQNPSNAVKNGGHVGSPLRGGFMLYDSGTNEESAHTLVKKDEPSSSEDIPQKYPRDDSKSTPRNKQKPKPKKTNARKHIKSLVTNYKFVILYVVMATLSGVGQLYIYSVGYIVSAQINKGSNPEHLNGAGYQALQVSLLSLTSFLGRLISGPLSDLIHKVLKYQRIWVLVIASCVSAMAQYLMIYLDDVHMLSVASLIVGTCYGTVFGVYPAVIVDYFGSNSFTTTWGLVTTSNIVSLTALNTMFGYVYDHNSVWDDKKEQLVCHLGKNCYNDVFRVNLSLCFLALLLCLFLIIQKRKQDQKIVPIGLQV